MGWQPAPDFCLVMITQGVIACMWQYTTTVTVLRNGHKKRDFSVLFFLWSPFFHLYWVLYYLNTLYIKKLRTHHLIRDITGHLLALLGVGPPYLLACAHKQKTVSTSELRVVNSKRCQSAITFLTSFSVKSTIGGKHLFYVQNLAPKVLVCVIFECSRFFFLGLKVAQFVGLISNWQYHAEHMFILISVRTIG